MLSGALLGRARELAELEAALDRAVAGRGGVFLISGEAGIGKSRLAEEVAERAGRRGVGVIWGRACEVDGAPPLWPWVQVLEACARTPAFLGGESPRLAGELDPLRLGSAVVALLRRMAGAGPLLLVFDDLHASDLASLELLHRVARELRDLRVLVLGTYREVEARRVSKMSALLARLAREGTARPLARLEPSAVVAALLESALGVAPTAAVASAVYAATEGNPLFVDALAHVLAARGPTAALVLPDSVRETALEMLARLAPAAREVLEAAAVLGRECAVTALQLVSGAPMDHVLAALDDGVAAGVLDPSSPVRFAHVLIREALYQLLPPLRRIELHARCARALARLHASDLDAHVAELAHHCFESGPIGSWLDAADYAARAGGRALELQAFDGAARHLERALVALDHAESPDDARRADLLWRLGVAQIGLGQAAAGRDRCERSAALAERAGRPDLFARAALAFGSEIVPGRTDPRLAELLAAALRLGAGGEALRVQVMARLAAARMPTLHRAEPLALARRAIVDARALGDPLVLSQVIMSARSVMTPAEDLEERAGLDRELAALAATLGDRMVAMQAHGRLALDAIEAADPIAVELELRIQRGLADELQVPQQQLRAACIRLAWATLQARPDDVARAEEDILELSGRVEDLRARAVIHANRLARADLAGDDAAATEALAALEAILVSDRSAATGPAVWLPIRRAVLLARQDRLDEVRAQIKQLAPDGPSPAYGALGPSILVVMAPICLRLGEREWTRALYDMLRPYGARNTINLALLVSDGPAGYHLGCLAAALGRSDEAAAHLQAAIETCDRAGFPAFGARARRALAELGRPVVAPRSSTTIPPRLERDGETWMLSHAGRRARLRDSKGVRYLAILLEEPGREFHVSDLIGPASEGAGDAGELLDARARAAYGARLARLDDALEDAEERSDRDGVARLRGEREALARELARAVGLGGRDRRAGSASERARINVQRRIRDVVTRLAQVDATLARHLELHVKTGVFCSFAP